MFAVVKLYLFVTIVTLVQCNVHPELLSMNQVQSKSAPFSACIDDSDCTADGNGYSCFQYICYPWEDDSAVPKHHRKSTCKSNEQCGSDLVCFRHHDRRNIHRGLCMEPITDCSENGISDCEIGGVDRSCCNGQYCCDQAYYTQLRSLPCVNDQGCKDMGYGNFCCPQKTNMTLPNICCNEDPNPPPPTTTTTRTTTTTTTPPSPAAQGQQTSGASRQQLSTVFVCFFVFLLALRQ